MKIKPTTILAAGLLLLSCTSEAQTSNDFQYLWDNFIISWEAEDATGCASIYHSDGINIPQGLPVNEGRTAIETFYESLFSANRSSRYTHKTESVSQNGDLAVEYASFNVDWTTNEGDEWTYHARVLVHWEKDNAGEWKIRTLLFNQPGNN
jgi:uncharacterized protein (TIGR02246 family)